MTKNSIIALLTDFGYEDAYVASMKGVILNIAPHATIIDITHNISPQNIDSAAYILWSSYKYFPKGTIFVCVVDPGVGSHRKILGVKTNKYVFLAPDNGLMKYVLASEKMLSVVSVENTRYFLPSISSTFHGRDIFAPVAAHLVCGVTFSSLGKGITPLTQAEHFLEVKRRGSYSGKVIHVDRFGNIITNFKLDARKFRKLTLSIKKTVLHQFHTTYVEAKSNSPFLIVGSSGLLEVSVKNGSASSLLKPTPLQPVHLKLE